MRLTRVHALILVVTTLASAGTVAWFQGRTGGRPAAGTTPSAATRALLDLSISTTSTRATIRFSPGILAAFRVTSAPPGAVVRGRPADDGLELSQARPGPAAVRVRVLYSEPTGAPDIVLSVSEAAAGVTRVGAAGAGPGRPVAVTVARSGPAAERAVPRAALFAPADPRLPHADGRRLVLAAYFPWFTPANEADPRLADRPAGSDDAWSYPSVLAMTRLARSHGIDGFAVSWQGNNQLYPFRLVLQAAEQTGGVATPVIETADANAAHDPGQPADPPTVTRFIREALATDDSPAFLRLDGVPVVFVYAMSRLPPAAWTSIRSQLAAAGTPAVLVGDGGWPQYEGVEDGWDLFDPNPLTSGQLPGQYLFAATMLRAGAAVDASVRPKLMVAAVSPGRDDRRLHGASSPVVARGDDGARYADTWRAALAADPDLVLVNSWNEWFEGTPVEPGVASGDLALGQTAAFAARFKRGDQEIS